jgi:3-oxoacyl-[acyl-carrier-protein] synthase II
VVITGVGCATPLGVGVTNLWNGCVNAGCGVDTISIFDASTWPTRIGAEVRDLDFKAVIAKFPEMKDAGRNALFAMAAADEAFHDSGLKPGGYDPERTGVYLGAGEGVPEFEAFVEVVAGAYADPVTNKPMLLNLATRRLNGMRELEQEPNLPGGHIAARFNAQGINCDCLTACAASSQALGEALEAIRYGDADIMFSGGCHSMLHPFGLSGFCLLTALTTRNDDPKGSSRPFDKQRAGFLLGEGAGILILEELEHAKARKAKIYGEMIGYGSSCDAFRLTDSHDEGRGAIACMSYALADAGIQPTEVDYINAHGTSTKVNDRVETLAAKKVFGDYAYKIPMSSTKGMTGHLIAAAGAVEMIICCKTIQDGIVPPTINQTESDPECDLDYVPNKARRHAVNVAMSNSFGFGGQNISLVLRRYAGS